MLILHRRLGETLTLRLSDDIDPATPIGDVLQNRDIIVALKWVGETLARLGVEAPRALKVLRPELLDGDKVG